MSNPQDLDSVLVRDGGGEGMKGSEIIVEDVHGRQIKIGDQVRQVLYDNGDPIPDILRRAPRGIEAIGTHRQILIEGSLQWQAGALFEKVDQ